MEKVAIIVLVILLPTAAPQPHDCDAQKSCLDCLSHPPCVFMDIFNEETARCVDKTKQKELSVAFVYNHISKCVHHVDHIIDLEVATSSHSEARPTSYVERINPKSGSGVRFVETTSSAFSSDVTDRPVPVEFSAENVLDTTTNGTATPLVDGWQLDPTQTFKCPTPPTKESRGERMHRSICRFGLLYEKGNATIKRDKKFRRVFRSLPMKDEKGKQYCMLLIWRRKNCPRV